MDADRLARIADALDGDGSLGRLLCLGVELMSVSGAGVAVVGDGQHRGAVAVSDPEVGALDDLQFSLGEGPCIDADRSERPVLEPDLATAVSQWPAFTPAALARGTRAVFAFPLRMGAVRLGVLSLYRATSGDLDDEDLRDAVLLSHVATHLLLELHADVTPGQLPDRLEDILDHRAHIHQATGMIAAQLGTDVATALIRLRAFAWSRERALDAVAADVVDGRLRFDDL